MKQLISFFKMLRCGQLFRERSDKEPDILHIPREAERAFRTSLYRYFRYNEPGLEYVIEYDPVFNPVMDCLCSEGWQVQLICNAYGELFFTICSGIHGKDYQHCREKQYK
ncbi:hypothetical protein [Niabella aquatica]